MSSWPQLLTTPAARVTATLQETPEDRSQEFVAVKGGAEEVSAMTLLVAAYVVLWTLLMAFLFLNWRRQAKLGLRLEELERAIAKHEEKDEGA